MNVRYRRSLDKFGSGGAVLAQMLTNPILRDPSLTRDPMRCKAGCREKSCKCGSPPPCNSSTNMNTVESDANDSNIASDSENEDERSFMTIFGDDVETLSLLSQRSTLAPQTCFAAMHENATDSRPIERSHPFGISDIAQDFSGYPHSNDTPSSMPSDPQQFNAERRASIPDARRPRRRNALDLRNPPPRSYHNARKRMRILSANERLNVTGNSEDSYEHTEDESVSFSSRSGDWHMHEVRRGETLAGLALTYGVHISSICRANQLAASAHVSTLYLERPYLTIPLPPNCRSADIPQKGTKDPKHFQSCPPSSSSRNALVSEFIRQAGEKQKRSQRPFRLGGLRSQSSSAIDEVEAAMYLELEEFSLSRAVERYNDDLKWENSPAARNAKAVTIGFQQQQRFDINNDDTKSFATLATPLRRKKSRLKRFLTF